MVSLGDSSEKRVGSVSLTASPTLHSSKRGSDGEVAARGCRRGGGGGGRGRPRGGGGRVRDPRAGRAVARRRGVVEEGERPIGGERRQPQRQARQLPRHRVEVHAVETALRDRPPHGGARLIVD